MPPVAPVPVAPATGRRARVAWWAGWSAVLVFCCLPLFVGLGRWDLRSDEAIYSYAVDRILETGEWLTPRNIPDDGPFLEKPPLKFWAVAAAIRSGLLPFDERGLRGLDALAAAVAFLYVYALGARLAGPVAGASAVLFLFSLPSLLHEHGLRSNNMEAWLLAVYCGGIYHAICWVEQVGATRRARHAYALMAWFTLAFLTKFVAALFLPLLALVTVALKPGGLRDLRAQWRDWGLPLLLSLAMVAPWFAYQSVHIGGYFWETILTAHVLQRFAGVLHPEHLHPWHYYLTWLYAELYRAQLAAVCLAGLCALLALASRSGHWTARVVLAWWLVPALMLSVATSKLFHYIYPYLPPLGIGVGIAVAGWLKLFDDHGPVASLLHRLGCDRWGIARDAKVAPILLAAGAVALALAACTAALAQPRVIWAGRTWFSNSLVWRPALVGAVCWVLAGRARWAARAAAVLVVLVALFPARYPRHFDLLLRQDHPLRAARDCAREVEAAGGAAGRGIYHASGDLHHAYFYYLRRLGPWMSWREATATELQRRLDMAGAQTPVLVSRSDYLALGGALPPGTPPVHPRGSEVPDLHPAEAFQGALPEGILFSDDIVLLLPQPFVACVPDVMAVSIDATRLPARAAPHP